MKRWFTLPRLLRAGAIVIALLGTIDPALSTTRFTRSDVAVLVADPGRDNALAGQVIRALARSFRVIPARFAAADATVIVGDRVVEQGAASGGKLFAVMPSTHGPALDVQSLDAPAGASLDAQVPVRVVIHAAHARGRSLEVTLRAGIMVVDRVVIPVTSDSVTLGAALAFVPTSAGTALLTVSAKIPGAPPAITRTATTAVEVHDTRAAVLFFDPRPSWMSTFVRRAIERDPRFVVTSRVTTSRNISTNAGSPPGSLAVASTLDGFDAIVAGAPDALTDGDVRGLESFMRRRGGRVILLLDSRARGPFDRLLAAGTWRGDSSSRIVEVTPSDSIHGALRASELAWPDVLPAGAIAVAGGVIGTARRAVIWRTPVGAGELTVSGALDSWRFRDAAGSGFDRFWRWLVADAAARAAPAMDVRVDPAVIAPGDSALLTLSIREAMLQGETQGGHAVVSASMASAGSPPEPIRLWPGDVVGEFRGVVRVGAAGDYRLTVGSGGDRVVRTLPVVAGAEQPHPEGRDLLAAAVASRGGNMLASSEVSKLPAAIRGAIGSAPHRERWHPMRSPWWILPFALLLAAEWLLRRRRGLA